MPTIKLTFEKDVFTLHNWHEMFTQKSLATLLSRITKPKVRFPIIGNVQYRARFHVDFSKSEGNLPYTVQFPLTLSEENTTFFLVNNNIIMVAYTAAILWLVIELQAYMKV